MFLLLFTGCTHGSFETGEIPEFGPVTTATWAHWANGKDSYDTLLLANRAGVCGKLQDYGVAYGAYLDALEDVDTEHYCRVMHQPTLDLADASAGLYEVGAHFASFALWSGESSEPQARPYEVDGERNTFQLTLSYYVAESPSLDGWKEDGTAATGCGMAEAQEEAADAVDVWTLADGSLTLSEVAAEDRAEGAGSGTALDAHGEKVGLVSYELSADWCEVPLN